MKLMGFHLLSFSMEKTGGLGGGHMSLNRETAFFQEDKKLTKGNRNKARGKLSLELSIYLQATPANFKIFIVWIPLRRTTKAKGSKWLWGVAFIFIHF